MAISEMYPSSLDTTMESASTFDFMDALRRLLEIGKQSDLTVVCRQKRWAIHKSVACSQSRFFEGAVNNPFRESQTGIIDLSEDDPEAVEHMINYFYHLDYLPTRHTRARGESLSSNASTAYGEDSRPASPFSDASTVAPSTPTTFGRKKLNLSLVEDPLLASAAANVPKPHASPYMSRFGPTSPLMSFPVKPTAEPVSPMDTFIDYNHMESADATEDSIPEQEPNFAHPYLVVHAKVYAIAEQYGIHGLKSLAKKKFATQMAYHRGSDEFAEALREVYEATIEADRGLRDIVIQTFRQFPEVAQRRSVGLVVKEIPSLAWELFRMAWGLPV